MTLPRSTTLLCNGRIYPSADSSSVFKALAIEGEVIIGLGSETELTDLAGSAVETVDLGGCVVLPGLIDAHIHMEKFALSLDQIECDTPTLEHCLEKVATRCRSASPGSWILGHGWDHNRWGTYGQAANLDAVAPDHPTYLTAHSLHAGWANTRALRLAGITSQTQDPPGGSIQRTGTGEPTGILFENAMRLVADAIPTPGTTALADRLQEAQERLWRFGITGIHDFDGPRCLDALLLMLERGSLGLRVLKSLPVALLETAQDLGLRTGFGNQWVRLGNIKVFADGALGPRTAAMVEPYEEEPANRGMLLFDQEELTAIGRLAAEAGFGLTIHAIGDRANHEVLDAFVALRAYEEENRLAPHRHRIEHLQLMHPDDLHRPAELGVIASMQPIHATSDMPLANRYWGPRAASAYAWRTQLDAGATLAFGSDAPVESPNPFLGLHAAISRRRPDGSPAPDGWIPDQRINLSEALSAYTIGPAFAAGMESSLGMLQPGYFADLLVLEKDPFQLAPEEIMGLQPVGTMVGGTWRFRAF